MLQRIQLKRVRGVEPVFLGERFDPKLHVDVRQFWLGCINAVSPFSYEPSRELEILFGRQLAAFPLSLKTPRASAKHNAVVWQEGWALQKRRRCAQSPSSTSNITSADASRYRAFSATLPLSKVSSDLRAPPRELAAANSACRPSRQTLRREL